MPDITSIPFIIAAIKNSLDIAKSVKDANYDLDKSILKEKIAMLVDSLLEAKIQASETLDIIQEKDKRITELEEKLKYKNNLVYISGVYIDKNDKHSTEPYCLHCWEVNKMPIHLNFQKNVEIKELYGDSRITNLFICPSCKNEFNYP
jgi:hypothetical protein